MRRFACQLVAAALVLGSSPTSAASGSSSTASPSTQQPSLWLALSMLTPAGTIGLTDAAIQPAKSNGGNAPAPLAFGSVRSPPVPVIGVWLGTVAMTVYILTREHHGRFVTPRPNSPG